MSDFAAGESFEEEMDVVVVPVVEGAVEDVEGDFIDEGGEDSFLDEGPFLVAEGGEDEYEGVDEDDAFAGGAPDAKIIFLYLFEMI